MIAPDYIIANENQHFSKFKAIHNAEVTANTVERRIKNSQRIVPEHTTANQ